jgi:hypothetical protein
VGYTTINLGLTLTVPTSGTRNWGQQVLTGAWNKISSHDHSGGGQGNQIDTAGLASDSVTSDKLAPNIALTQASLITVTGVNQSVTVDFDLGNIHVINLQAATGTLTVSFANAQAGAEYKLFFINPATALTFTWPAAVKWPQAQEPIWTESSGAVDGVSLYYTGAVYYSDWQLNFS